MQAQDDRDSSLYVIEAVMVSLIFFFSSRRRHTRLQGDWSSDVCSSDLAGEQGRGVTTRSGDGLANRQGKTSQRAAKVTFARRIRAIEPFLAVEMGERADRKSVV